MNLFQGPYGPRVPARNLANRGPKCLSDRLVGPPPDSSMDALGNACNDQAPNPHPKNIYAFLRDFWGPVVYQLFFAYFWTSRLKVFLGSYCGNSKSLSWSRGQPLPLHSWIVGSTISSIVQRKAKARCEARLVRVYGSLFICFRIFWTIADCCKLLQNISDNYYGLFRTVTDYCGLDRSICDYFGDELFRIITDHSRPLVSWTISRCIQAGRHALLLNKKRCLLVVPEDMSSLSTRSVCLVIKKTCLPVNQEDMYYGWTRRHISLSKTMDFSISFRMSSAYSGDMILKGVLT